MADEKIELPASTLDRAVIAEHLAEVYRIMIRMRGEMAEQAMSRAVLVEQHRDLFDEINLLANYLTR